MEARVRCSLHLLLRSSWLHTGRARVPLRPGYLEILHARVECTHRLHIGEVDFHILLINPIFSVWFVRSSIFGMRQQGQAPGRLEATKSRVPFSDPTDSV